MSATPLTNEFVVTSPGATAGALLRQAREATGLHIGALAVSLKVPVKKIEALEADRLDLLPDVVFARALTASICRTLKVDATAILAALPQGAGPKLKTDDRNLNTAYLASGASVVGSNVGLLGKPSVWIGMALLVGALAMLLLPGKEPELPTATPVANGATPAAPEPAKDSVTASTNVAQPVVESTAATSTLATVATTAAPAAASVSTAPAADVSAADGLVVFSAKGASWVEVTDAAGVVQLRKTMAAGETIGTSGRAPLKVTIGRADAIAAKVRGKDFDLGPVSRDNVARFEVK